MERFDRFQHVIKHSDLLNELELGHFDHDIFVFDIRGNREFKNVQACLNWNVFDMIRGNILSVDDDDNIIAGAHGTCSLTKKEIHEIYGSPPIYNRIPWSGSSTEGIGNQLGLNYCLINTMYDKFISP